MYSVELKSSRRFLFSVFGKYLVNHGFFEKPKTLINLSPKQATFLYNLINYSNYSSFPFSTRYIIRIYIYQFRRYSFVLHTISSNFLALPGIILTRAKFALSRLHPLSSRPTCNDFTPNQIPYHFVVDLFTANVLKVDFNNGISRFTRRAFRAS